MFDRFLKVNSVQNIQYPRFVNYLHLQNDLTKTLTWFRQVLSISLGLVLIWSSCNVFADGFEPIPSDLCNNYPKGYSPRDERLKLLMSDLCRPVNQPLNQPLTADTLNVYVSPENVQSDSINECSSQQWCK